jgi:hypothetical protein
MAKSQSKRRWGETRRRRWTESEARQVLAAHQGSGLSASRFAAEQGLDPERLRRWSRRLQAMPKRGNSVRERPVGFSEVAVSGGQVLPVQPVTAFEIVLGSGQIVRVGHSFDVDGLRRLLKVLTEVGG